MQHLADLNVVQISFTRLEPVAKSHLDTEHHEEGIHEMPRLRVRLDLASIRGDAADEKVDLVAKDVCKLLFWDLGENFANKFCEKKLIVTQTRLFDMSNSAKRRKFSTYTDEPDSP